MLNVQGTIKATPPNRAHSDNSGSINAGEIADNQQKAIWIQNFDNLGNVPQTVSHTVTNPTNVTVVSSSFYTKNPDVDARTELGASTTIQPGQGVHLKVVVQATDIPIGDDVTYGFNVEPTWV
jgi:hypothetical protein